MAYKHISIMSNIKLSLQARTFSFSRCHYTHYTQLSTLSKRMLNDSYDRKCTNMCHPRSVYFSYRNYCSRALSEKSNIIIIGSPGSGKTTVGRILGNKLNKSVLDVDDDYLESYWNKPVAEKLFEVGSDKFIEEEGNALKQLDVTDSVVSLTGSNPMNKEAMDTFRKSGLVVYLDVRTKDILDRLEKMKVQRIVGQEAGIPMTDILPFRQRFYESSYDVRIICEAYEDQESIAGKICQAIDNLQSPQGYVSTREDFRQARERTFNEAVLEGLAYDGGLYVPSYDIPYFAPNEWARLLPLSFAERAQRILEKWIYYKDIHPLQLSNMIQSAYTQENFPNEKIFPVEKLYQDKIHNDEYMLELFHGPTASFKDGALQLSPKFFQHALNENSEDERYLILVATSGDTGGAVLNGFGKVADDSGRIKVMVLYPENGISSIQKAQMTTAQGDNVKVIGVKSDFDFCQTSIKNIFNDSEFAKNLKKDFNCKLSAANSINFGRLLPQVVYHASAYLDLVQQNKVILGHPIDLCIPTGNFGNMLAAYYAQQMGIPYRYLVCASNINNILTEFFNTGRYTLTGRQITSSSAPAIDILKSSNLERFLYHMMYRDHKKVKELYGDLDRQGYFALPRQDFREIQQSFKADWCVEDACLSCIKKTYDKTGYLLDPHTAVAKVVADKFRDDNVPMLIASTAHYAKFAPEVLRALGHPSDSNAEPRELFASLEALDVRPIMHEQLKAGVLRPRVHHDVIEPSVENIVREIKAFVGS